MGKFGKEDSAFKTHSEGFDCSLCELIKRAFGYKMPLVDGVEPSSSMSGEWAACTLCFGPHSHRTAHYS